MIMNQHNTPLNELKKNYNKMLNCDIVSKEDIEEIKNDIDAVSYTHLTLPTILLV